MIYEFINLRGSLGLRSARFEFKSCLWTSKKINKLMETAKLLEMVETTKIAKAS